jgi:hypothetical protein
MFSDIQIGPAPCLAGRFVDFGSGPSVDTLLATSQ